MDWKSNLTKLNNCNLEILTDSKITLTFSCCMLYIGTSFCKHQLSFNNFDDGVEERRVMKFRNFTCSHNKTNIFLFPTSLGWINEWNILLSYLLFQVEVSLDVTSRV